MFWNILRKEIQSTMKTLFFDDKPVSAEEFLQNLYGRLPEFFKNEAELREIWSVPKTRLLKKLEAAGYHKDSLADLQERDRCRKERFLMLWKKLQILKIMSKESTAKEIVESLLCETKSFFQSSRSEKKEGERKQKMDRNKNFFRKSNVRKKEYLPQPRFSSRTYILSYGI